MLLRYTISRGVYLNQAICDAIKDRSILKFIYDGHFRVVEPYAYGLSLTGIEAIHCYQTEGTSDSGQVRAWKMMAVSEIKSLIVTEEHFSGERDGYTRGDKHMRTIFCEL